MKDSEDGRVKMNKPTLYRFKFYEESGTIESEAIEDYKEVVWYGKTEYRYKLNGSVRVVKAGNIDKYIYEQVHSFNPSESHAREIIFDAISIKYLKADADAQKYRNLMEKVRIKEYEENNNIKYRRH